MFYSNIIHIFAAELIFIVELNVFIAMANNKIDKMLLFLKEQEKRIIESDKQKIYEGEIKLSPKINIEERLRNGYISADDYVKTHQ